MKNTNKTKTATTVATPSRDPKGRFVSNSASATMSPVKAPTIVRDSKGRFASPVASKPVIIKSANVTTRDSKGRYVSPNPVQVTNTKPSSFIKSFEINDDQVEVVMTANPKTTYVYKLKASIINKILKAKSLGNAYNKYVRGNETHRIIVK